jgi:hypothetical protein
MVKATVEAVGSVIKLGFMLAGEVMLAVDTRTL